MPVEKKPLSLDELARQKRESMRSKGYPPDAIPSLRSIKELIEEEQLHNARNEGVKRIDAIRQRQLTEVPDGEKPALMESFHRRDAIAQGLRAGRRHDQQGWINVGGTPVWDISLAEIRRYYGIDLVAAAREAIDKTGVRRVLILGAGTGREAAELSRELGEDVEVHATALKRQDSHRDYEKQNPNLHIHICHFRNMVSELRGESYALVFSHRATTHVSDSGEVVDSVYRLLAERGTAMIDTFNRIPNNKLRQWRETFPLEPHACWRYILKK